MRRNIVLTAVLALVAGSVVLAAGSASKSKGSEAEKPAAPKNLIENGDFEKGPVGPESKGKLPPGWRGPFVTAKVCEIIEETRPKSAGKRCLKIGANEKSKSSGLYSKLAPVDPKKPLLVSGWMKAGGMMKIPQGSYFGIGWYDKDRKGIAIKKGSTMNYYYLHSGYKADKWIPRKTIYKPTKEKKETYKGSEIPPNAAFFDIRIFCLEYPKPAYFDDIFATQEIPALKPKK